MILLYKVERQIKCFERGHRVYLVISDQRLHSHGGSGLTEDFSLSSDGMAVKNDVMLVLNSGIIQL